MKLRSLEFVIGLAFCAAAAAAQVPDTGIIRGSVTLLDSSEPVRGAVVLVVGLGKFGVSDDHGQFEIHGVAPGTWDVLAQREHLTADRERVVVEAGGVAEVYFLLELSPIHEEITVTASAGSESTSLDVFNAVTSLDSFELVENISGTIGEVLKEQPGMASRSFGPGSSRPIIRGFDGDRVLVMQDGIRTGDLGSQSGDHGVSIDPTSLQRLEVVKGPATLLYGSNAIGGVVNAITPQDSYRRDRPAGARGQLIADAGTTNDQAGVNGNLQYGHDRWMFWGSGGARRSADYGTPEGKVLNSATRSANGSAGLGLYGERAYTSFGFTGENGRYGVPFAGSFEGGGGGEDAPLIDLEQMRKVGRFDFGLPSMDAGFLDSARFTVSLIDWHHEEIEVEDGRESIGTTFDNRTYVFRGELEQKRGSRLTGKLGVWAQHRDYVTVGAEALAPPTIQNAFAAFAYEEVSLAERVRLQLGARVELNDYNPDDRPPSEDAELPVPVARARTFTGLSTSAGVHFELTQTSAFVANLTRSYRAPALEELYNFGPHVGTLSFEIGNPDLEREASLGFDLSLRTQRRAFRGEINFYRYGIDNFVFPSFTDQIVDGLRLAYYLQGKSRFTGFDGQASLRLHSSVWLHAGAGYVDAKLTSTDEPLPRIPPLQGRVELEITRGGFTVKPEVILAARQDDVFRSETPTAGYAVANLNGSYILAGRHVAHIFSVKAFNLTNALYREHTSFIKDLAPEIGRGIKFSYSVRFF